MLNLEKTGKQIAMLRREKSMTGEKLAELLGVSPQAVSKWENGKCLPETSMLPGLAKVLGCSIDTLLMPKELLILEANFTDGQIHIPITQVLNNLIYDNKLNVCVKNESLGASIDSGRLKLVTVKYQTPDGTFFTYAFQNERLCIDLQAVNNAEAQFTELSGFKIIDAYYGNEKVYMSAMQKMKHYEYFKWDKIRVNHETFPSVTASDDIEYLTLVYLNDKGINTISCAENDCLYYDKGHTSLYLKDTTSCILPGIIKLNWGNGMECPWAGALYASLKYMGENYTYEQIMGLSGACYRVCHVDIWDWSCTDALVAFDYSSILFKAIGYEPIWANRIKKEERKAERQAIMQDLQDNKPVIAINLREAPEWGVITGYIDSGNEFLCRTYFDNEVFESKTSEELKLSERGGYLVNDFWPFLITHFGDKKEKPSPRENLMSSLKALADSFDAPKNRGYYQGKEAYEAWIRGLSDEASFTNYNDKESISRRLSVNESMLFCLIDAKRCAEAYLKENIPLLSEDKQPLLIKIINNYKIIHDMVFDFRNKAYYDCQKDITELNGVSTPGLRREQINLLTKVLILEQENADIAKELLVIS